MASIENPQDGTFEDYPETPDVEAVTRKLLSEGYTRQQIQNTLANSPVNNTVAAAVQRVLGNGPAYDERAIQAQQGLGTPIQRNRVAPVQENMTNGNVPAPRITGSVLRDPNNQVAIDNSAFYDPSIGGSKRQRVSALTELKRSQTEAASKEKYKYTDNKGIIEGLNDSTVAIGVGALNVAESGYEVLNMATRNVGMVTQKPFEFITRMAKGESAQDIIKDPEFRQNLELGNSSEVRKLFDKARDSLRGYQSQTAKNDNFNVNLAMSDLMQARDNNLAAKVDSKGENSWWDILSSEAGKASDVMGVYLSNPSILTDTAIESGLQFVIPAGAANLYGKAATKSAELSAEAIKRNAELISTGAIGLMEGASAGAEAQEQVRSMSFAELEKTSDLYRSLIADGISEEDAREIVGSNVYGSVAGFNSVMAGALGKLTGAAKLEGDLFQTGTGSLLNMPFKALIAGTREGIEEAGQSASGRLTQNTAINLFADNTQGITEGVGQDVGLGFITGAAMGGTLGAVGAVTEGLKKQAGYLADLHRIAKGEIANVTNPASPNYDSYRAVKALLDPRVLNNERFNDPKKRREHFEQVRLHASTLRKETNELQERLENAENEQERVQLIKEAETKAKQAGEIGTMWQGYVRAMESENIAEIQNIVAEFDQASDEDVKRVTRYLGSNPESIPVEDLNTILNDDRISEEDKSYISDAIQYRNNVERYVESRKSLENVRSNVVDGGTGYRGIKDYMRSISTALLEDRFDVAESELDSLRKFTARHKAKAELAQRAFKQVNGSNPETNNDAIVEYSNKYSQLDGKPAFIGTNSGRYVESLQQEQELLTEAVALAEKQMNIANTDTDSTVEDVNINDRDFTDTSSQQPTEETSTVDPMDKWRKPKDAVKAAINPNNVSEPEAQESRNIKSSQATDTNTQNTKQPDNTGTDTTVRAQEKIKETFDVRTNNGLLGKLSDFYQTLLTNPAGLGDIVSERNSADTYGIRAYRAFHKNIVGPVNTALQSALTIQQPNATGLTIYDLVQEESIEYVQNALTTAVFEWIGSTGGKTVNTGDQIAAIVGKNDKSELTKAERDIYRDVGDVASTIYADIGRAAIEKLGFKFKPGVSEYHRQNLINQLGLAGIDALRNANVVELVTIENSMLLKQGILTNEEVGNTKEAKERGERNRKNDVTNYIRLVTKYSAKDKAMVLPPSISKTVKANAIYQETYEKLFGSTAVKVPKLKPPTKVNDKVVRVGTTISKEQKDTLYTHQRRPVRKNSTFDLVTKLSLASVREMAGLVSDFSNIHEIERENIEKGSNSQIVKDLDNALTWGNALGRRVFYLEHNVWSNMRMGVANNFVNMQGSKVSRALFNYTEHEKAVNTSLARLYFKMAALQHMGHKVENMTQSDIENAFENLINDQEVKNAREAIKILEASTGDIDSTLRTQLEDRIKSVVANGGENLMSLQTLVELNKYDPDNVFTSTLALEIDGKANGVLLSTIQMVGLKDGKTADAVLHDLAAGGVFADGTLNYADYAQNPNSKDYYERFATEWNRILNSYEMTIPERWALEFLHKPFESRESSIDDDVITYHVTKDGRNMAKPPTMTVVYGAGIFRIVNDYVNTQIEKLYKQAAATNNPKDLAMLKNALVNLGVSDASVNKLTMETKNTWMLNKKDDKKLRSKLRNTYGEALQTTLETSFTHIMKVRDSLNGMADVATKMFKTIYENRVATYKQENGLNDNDILSREQEEEIFTELLDVSPVVPTAMSEGLADGLRLFKLERKPNQEASRYTLSSPKRKLVKNPDGSISESTKLVKDKNGNTQRVPQQFKSISTSTYFNTIQNSGASTVVKNIHQLDASIMVQVLKKVAALNVHDAVFVHPADASTAGLTFNMAVGNYGYDFNMVENIVDMYNRVDAEYRKQVKKVPKELFLDHRGEPVPMLSTKAAKQFTDRKKRVLGRVTSIDQYSLLGGNVRQGVLNQARRKDYANVVKNLVEDKEKMITDLEVSLGLLEYTNINLTEEETYIPAIVSQLINSDPDILNNSAEAFGDFNPDEKVQLDSQNSMNMFNKLNNIDASKLNPRHQNRLQTVMQDLVNNVIQPLRLQIENGAASAVGRYNTVNRSVDIKIPRSNVTTATMTSSEIYVHELVHAVTNTALNNPENGNLRRYLEEMYEYAQENLTVEDIAGENPTAKDLEEARRTYEYVFNQTGSGDNNSYMDEFVAYGLTNEKFINALNKLTVTKGLRHKLNRNTYKGQYKSTLFGQIDKLTDFIFQWFKDVLHDFFLKRYDVFNQKGGDALFNLVKHIAEVEVRSTNRISQYAKKVQKGNDFLSSALNNLVVGPLSNLGQKIPESDNRFINAIPSAVRAVSRAKDITYSGTVMAMKQLAHRHNLTEQSFARAMANEFAGATKSRNGWNNLMRLSHLMIDQTRNNQKIETQRIVGDKFVSDLTPEDKRVLYRVGLNLDLSSLIETPPELTDMNSSPEVIDNPKYKKQRESDFRYVHKLIDDVAYRESEINRLKTEIRNGTSDEHAKHIIAYSDSLGLELATGTFNTVNHASNANVIVRAYNNKAITPQGDLNVLERLTDRLATITGIAESKQEDVAAMSRIMKKELEANNNDIDNNGVMFTLQMHNFFKRQSLDKLFEGNPTQVMKGYVREEFDPNIEMVFVKEGAIAEAEQAGYVNHGKAAIDYEDPNRQEFYMMTRDAPAMESWMKTTMSFTGRRARGHRLVDVYNLTEDSVVSSIEAREDNKYLKGVFDARQRSGQYIDSNAALKPIFSPDGKISGYRYVMTHDKKELVLNMNTEFDAALGRMVGSISDKVNTKIINRASVVEAKAQYDREYTSNPSNFVYIGREATDKEHLDMWNQLPNEVKEDVQQVWGDTGMYVNKDDFVKILGFRKFSVADWAENQRALPPALRQFHNILGDRLLKLLGGHNSRRFGRGLAELTKLAKDSIVIKTFDVLWNNIISNSLVLFTEGINPYKAAKWSVEGWRYAEEYQDNQAQVVDLTNELEASPHYSSAERKKILAKISRLKEQMRVSPVHDLIEQGVFQTIVEDLEFEDNRYTYLQKVADKAEPFTDHVPEFVKDIGSVLFLTHDTKLYKVYRNTTQLSDFAARYAMHKANKEKGMNTDDSINMIMDTFIDYDSPTHKSIQYLNDMGFLMFTKFFIRIQKVILRQAINKPLNIAVLLTFQQLFGLGDSTIFGTFIGDPENWQNRISGPLNNLGSVLQLHGLNGAL